MSDPSKFSKAVCAKISRDPAGMVLVPHSAKCLEPMSTVTTTPLIEVLLRLSIRSALVSQPPLELSDTPTNTTLEEPFHGLGFGLVFPL